jgi:hypothetical protein
MLKCVILVKEARTAASTDATYHIDRLGLHLLGVNQLTDHHRGQMRTSIENLRIVSSKGP